jgi:hypothetical protein
MAPDIGGPDRPEGTGSDVKRDLAPSDASVLQGLDHAGREVKASRRCGDGSLHLGIYGLIPLAVLLGQGRVPADDVGRDGHPSDVVQHVPEWPRAFKGQDPIAFGGPVDDGSPNIGREPEDVAGTNPPTRSEQDLPSFGTRRLRRERAKEEDLDEAGPAAPVQTTVKTGRQDPAVIDDDDVPLPEEGR